MADRIGFVGLGNMGRPMAERLIATGYDVTACDRNVASTHGMPCVRPDIRALVHDAGVIFLSLPTPQIVESVAAEIAQSGGCARTIVDLSTTGPDASRRTAALLAPQGIELVDCPVSGGVSGARAGTLALMAGASDAGLERVRAMLERLGRVFHVGREPGMGQMMKVINNLLSASALAISGESVAMAVKAGLDPDTVVSVLNAGSGRNSATLDKFPRQVLTGSFDAGFSMGLMVKDVLLCMEQARGMGLDMPFARTIADVWRQAQDTMGADADFTRVVQVAEEAAGVAIRSRPVDEAVAHG